MVYDVRNDPKTGEPLVYGLTDSEWHAIAGDGNIGLLPPHDAYPNGRFVRRGEQVEAERHAAESTTKNSPRPLTDLERVDKKAHWRRAKFGYSRGGRQTEDSDKS